MYLRNQDEIELANKSESESKSKKKPLPTFGAHAASIDNQLRRYEFFDFLVVIANNTVKLRKENAEATGSKQSMPESPNTVASMLESIIKKHILFHNQFRMRSQLFRNKALWTLKVNQLYKENLDFLA